MSVRIARIDQLPMSSERQPVDRLPKLGRAGVVVEPRRRGLAVSHQHLTAGETSLKIAGAVSETGNHFP